MPQHPVSPAPAALPCVGDYRLLARIGEGGMGVVHLAQAPDGARVALKVLRPHVVGDDEARERLAREVASLRRVHSPRVAEVIDADPWGRTPYVATRYVPGLSLHEHARQHGPVTGADLAFLATGLLEAVIAVHRVGVLHRDIKPTNVLLEGRAPVLIDFGLARLAEDPRLTQAGWLLGTPGYLAPEILYGDDATTASDVHSWAATVAFAATGRPPFGTGPAMAIMDRVRRGEHDLSAVPSALLPLVRHGLAPDPGERPGTEALLASLRAAAPGSCAAGAREPQREGPRPAPREQLTVPVALASLAEHPDEDGTRLLGPPPSDQPAGDQPVREQVTREQPARAPYDVPAPPATAPYRPVPAAGDPRAGRPEEPPTRPGLVPPGARRPPPGGVRRIQRTMTLAALFVTATLAFAWAPYRTVLVLGLGALVVRTLSWTTDSARERQHLRGRRRWYDATLTAATVPWYLVVAVGGTLLLVVWASVVMLVVALAVALASLLFHGSLVPGLMVTGAAFAVALWWGPGARRMRVPVRRVVVAATRHPTVGWVVLGGVLLAAGLCAVGLAAGGSTWAPFAGAPWREGTLLGSVVGWF